MKGKFNVKGKAEMQFWIRAFQFEDAIAHAQKTINSSSATSAMVPIIAEYESGRIYWQACLVCKVDALGLQNGEGRVWVSDAADREAMVEECATLAREILDGVPYQECWEMKTQKDV